jgi:hypothetical protein
MAAEIHPRCARVRGVPARLPPPRRLSSWLRGSVSRAGSPSPRSPTPHTRRRRRCPSFHAGRPGRHSMSPTASPPKLAHSLAARAPRRAPLERARRTTSPSRCLAQGTSRRSPRALPNCSTVRRIGCSRSTRSPRCSLSTRRSSTPISRSSASCGCPPRGDVRHCASIATRCSRFCGSERHTGRQLRPGGGRRRRNVAPRPASSCCRMSRDRRHRLDRADPAARSRRRTPMLSSQRPTVR